MIEKKWLDMFFKIGPVVWLSDNYLFPCLSCSMREGGIFDHGNSEKAILSLSEIMNYTFPLLLNIY